MAVQAGEEVVLSFGCLCESVCRFGEPDRTVLEAIWHLMMEAEGVRGRAARSSLGDGGENLVAALEDGRLNKVAVEADLGARVHQRTFT